MKIKAVRVIGNTSMEAHLFIKIIVRFLLIPRSQFILSSLHQSCISLLEYIFSVSFFFLYVMTALSLLLYSDVNLCSSFLFFWENLKHFFKSSICYWCYFSILLWAMGLQKLHEGMAPLVVLWLSHGDRFTSE